MMKDLQYPDGTLNMDGEAPWEEADALSDEHFLGACEQYSLPQLDPLSSRRAPVDTGTTQTMQMMQHRHLPIVRAALEQIAAQQ